MRIRRGVSRSPQVATWLISLLLFSSQACGVIDRIISVSTGFGIPNLVCAEVAVMAFPPHVQIGFGYGILPGLTSFNIPVPQQSTTLADGNTYTFTPTVVGSISMLSPFIRYFPTERNFYFQLNYALLNISAPFSSDLTLQPVGPTIPSALTGTINILQSMPTISMGHIFAGKVYFVNINMGFTFLSTTYVTSSLILQNPILFGGASANIPALTQATTQVNAAVVQAANQAKTNFVVMPSFVLMFGLLL